MMVLIPIIISCVSIARNSIYWFAVYFIIGSLAPGESAPARFKLKVDETATTKMYGINSEIKYEDVDGHDRISDSIKIQVETLPAVSTVEKFKNVLLIGFVVVLLIVVVLGVRSYKNKQE